MNLNLTNQTTAKNTIGPYLVSLKNLMDQRKVIWDRLPNEKRIAWANSNKDPVMALAVDVFKYLKINFYDMVQNDL